MFEFIANVLASPFWQVVLTTVATALAADYAAFKKFQSFEEFAAYRWGLAAWRAAQGFVVGVVGGLSLPVLAEALKRLSVVLLILVLGACASRATRGGQPIAPEAEAALRMTQVVGALNALTIPPGSSPIERLVASKVLTNADGQAVATVLSQAMGYAKDAGLVLEASLAARTAADKQRGHLRASVLIRTLADSLAAAPINVGTPQARKAVVDLLRLASGLVLTVGSFLPVPAPEGPPPSLDDALAF